MQVNERHAAPGLWRRRGGSRRFLRPAASAQCQIQPTQAWCVVCGPSQGILRICLKDGSARASHEGLDMAVQSRNVIYYIEVLVR
jgi:hypothetical protein